MKAKDLNKKKKKTYDKLIFLHNTFAYDVPVLRRARDHVLSCERIKKNLYIPSENNCRNNNVIKFDRFDRFHCRSALIFCIQFGKSVVTRIQSGGKKAESNVHDV